MQLASFSMAEVTYATGDIAYLVQEQAKLATFRVKAKQENVSGVILPGFEVERVAGSGRFSFVWPNESNISILLNRVQFNWPWKRRTANHEGSRSIRKGD